jgi:hypothetical protein
LCRCRRGQTWDRLLHLSLYVSLLDSAVSQKTHGDTFTVSVNAALTDAFHSSLNAHARTVQSDHCADIGTVAAPCVLQNAHACIVPSPTSADRFLLLEKAVKQTDADRSNPEPGESLPSLQRPPALTGAAALVPVSNAVVVCWQPTVWFNQASRMGEASDVPAAEGTQGRAGVVAARQGHRPAATARAANAKKHTCSGPGQQRHTLVAAYCGGAA